MAITNAGELKTAVQNWMLSLSDEISASAADILRFSQGYLNMKLRTSDMETVEQLTIASGEATLPTYFLAPRQVVHLNGSRRITLKQVTKVRADLNYPYREGAAVGAEFSITGNKLRVYPTLPDGELIELTYYKALVELADEDTDWLINKYPHVYLAACQMWAADFIKENEEAQKYAGIIDVFAAMTNVSDEQAEMMMAEAEGSPI